MNPNPFLGVFFHWLGGLASGSFYVPYRFVRRWSWETYWLAGGVFSWIIVPWLLGSLMTYDLLKVFGEVPASCHFWTYFWGVMWGLGGLTFGLTMRYLGMSLGMAVALGYCAAFGTLMPPIFHGEFMTKVLGTQSGLWILAGVGVCLAGIVVAGLAGMSKESEMSEEQKKSSIKEFDFKKGILVATFCGVMSACFAYGLDAGRPIKERSLKFALLHDARADGYRVHNPTPDEVFNADLKLMPPSNLAETLKDFEDPSLKLVVFEVAAAGGDANKYLDNHRLWQGLPVLVVLLLGGFTTNFIWCLLLNIKNKTTYQYFSGTVREGMPGRDEETIIETAIDAPSEEVVEHIPRAKSDSARVPMLWNYFFCALAGTTWYFQFFFYTMGESQMGAYKFSSWTLHMASIIVFSTLWGIALREWKGSSGHTIALVTLGLAVLIASTILVGYGNYLGTLPGSQG